METQRTDETTRGYATTAEVAARLRVHPVTVRRLITAGELVAVRIGPRGTFRIRPESVDHLIARGGGATHE